MIIFELCDFEDPDSAYDMAMSFAKEMTYDAMICVYVEDKVCFLDCDCYDIEWHSDYYSDRTGMEVGVMKKLSEGILHGRHIWIMDRCRDQRGG